MSFSSVSRRHALLLLGAVCTGLRALNAAIAKTDLIPPFLELWKQPNLTSEIRAKRFLEMVVKPNLDLYDGFVGSVSLERATEYIEEVEPLVPMIAKLDGAQADLSVLTSHELFHKYHASFHPEWKGQRGKDMPLHRLVWVEGLATFASQRLNPNAAEAAIFRSATLASACREHVRTLAVALLENLDSTQKAPFIEWMSGKARSSNVPPRAGYYFGWRVAQSLGGDRSFHELAALTDSEARAGIVRELKRMQETGSRPQ